MNFDSTRWNLGRYWERDLMHSDRLLLWRAAGLVGRPPFGVEPPPASWHALPASHKTLLDAAARKVYYLGRCLSLLGKPKQ